MPPRLIDDEVLGAVGDMAAAFEGFAVLFPDVREFPSVVWLRPDPEDRFRALTRALVAAFPDCPPYRGRFPDPQPHMTVGMDLDPQTQAELREQTDREVTPRLPFHAVVTSMSLLILNEHGAWREEARFAFRTADASTQ